MSPLHNKKEDITMITASAWCAATPWEAMQQAHLWCKFLK